MRTGLMAAVLAAAALLGCAHGAPADEKPKVFNKLGGVVFLGGSASFDEDEVNGPLINMSTRSDGTWAGTINNEVVDVNVYSGRAAGSSLTMKWSDEPNHRVIAGAFRDQPYRFEIFPDHISVRLPTRSFDLQHRQDFSFGPGGELKLEGQAQSLTAPMPQFGMAMLATFIASSAQMRDATGDPNMPFTGPQ